MARNEAKIVFTGDVSSALSAISRLKRELSGAQSFAANALAFGGISLGTAEIIRMADEYGQLMSRLQLATRYTGDYAAVQKQLQQVASDTRTDISATVDMYTKLSPALLAVGRSSSQSLGVISTVNKAVALSGVSGETAAAGIMQFVQALGKGSLNGDELNSILENTPGLADAIAEGMGRTRGELKQLGADGKLSAEVVVEALERVRDRVDSDFSKLPLTVGQAFTILQNTLVESVGTAGQTTGAMSALARAIVQVSDAIKSFSVSDGARWLSEFLIETADGAARVFRIVGRYLAAWTAAMQTSREQATAVWQAFFDDVEAIADEKWQHEQRYEQIVATEKEVAGQRLDIERQLQEKRAELAKKIAIAEGKVSADILETDDKRVAAQIKNAEKVRAAFSAAWRSALKDAEAAGEAAAKLFDQAAGTRQSGADRAAAKRRSALSPEEQQADIQSEFESAASAASNAAGLARLAELHGRTENAAKLAKEAERAAEKAAKLADQIDDPELGARAIEQAAEIQAQLQEAQARKKQEDQAAYEKQAAATATAMAQMDEQLSALQAKAAALKVQADITQAEGAISALQKQLDAIPDNKTVTVTVKQVVEAAASDPNNPTGWLGDLYNPAAAVGTTGASFARGGYTGSGGKYQPAGIVHAGEFVLRQEVVRQRGALEFLARFNQIGLSALKGYASGGLVSGLRVPSITPRAASSASSGTPIILDLNGRRYPVTAASDVAGDLNTAFRREALKRGVRT